MEERVQLKVTKLKRAEETKEKIEVHLKRVKKLQMPEEQQVIVEELPQQVSNVIDQGKVEEMLTKTRVKKRKDSVTKNTKIMIKVKEGKTPTVIIQEKIITEFKSYRKKSTKLQLLNRGKKS